MNIYPFRGSDEEYTALLELNRQLDPERLYTVEWLREQEKELAEENRVVRVLGQVEQQIVASGAYWQPLQVGDKTHHFVFSVHPAQQESSIPRLMHDYLLACIGQEEPSAIVSEAKEDERYRTALLEESGFTPRMRFPRSYLDVTAVNSAAYQEMKAELERQGIRFITLTDAMQEDTQWQHNVWRMFTAIDQDVPSPEPVQVTPFDEYAEYYAGSYFRPDSWAIAIDTTLTGEERYVGMCVVNIMPTRPDSLFAGITGVVRSHRRRKIATVLKVRSVAYAQTHGYRKIYTDNEEHNPMYDLNRQLGFAPLPAWVYYKKEIA